MISFFFFFKYFIYLFLERGAGREEEEEKHQRERNINRLLLSRCQLGTWPTTQACALTGDPTGDLLVQFTGWHSIHWPHQPSLYDFLNKNWELHLLNKFILY